MLRFLAVSIGATLIGFALATLVAVATRLPNYFVYALPYASIFLAIGLALLMKAEREEAYSEVRE